MFEFTDKDGSMTRISHVSILQVSTKHFMCLSHQKQEGTDGGQDTTQRKVPSAFVDSIGNHLDFEKRQEIGSSDKQQNAKDLEEDGEEEHNESLETYKRMRLGLATTLISGDISRQSDLHGVSKTKSNLLSQGPPSSLVSSAVHWRRLDPSETIVLN